MTIDVLLSSSWDLRANNVLADGVAVIRQRIRVRLLTYLGEWLLDRREGIDWLGLLQAKPAPVETLGGIIRREVESVPGVVAVDSFTSGAIGRSLTYTGVVTYDDGSSEDIALSVDPSAPDVNAVVTFP